MPDPAPSSKYSEKEHACYFASPEVVGEDFAGKLLEKIEQWDQNKGTTVGVLREKLGLAYNYYYGFSPEGVHTASAIARDGEVGQLAKIRVNHSRALVSTLYNLVVAERVVWNPRATNLDYESLKQVELARGALEYYWYMGRVEERFNQATEESIPFTEGFVHAPWDETLGDEVGPDPEVAAAALAAFTPGAPPPPAEPTPAMEPTAPAEGEAEAPPPLPKLQRAGDFRFEVVSSWNVLRDPHKRSFDSCDCFVVRVWRNRFDLLSQYPEFEKEIYSAPAEINTSKNGPSAKSESDDIPVYYFYHKRTGAVSEGRESVLLGNKALLKDGSLSYDELPLFRVRPAEMIGTPFGYSPYLEILSLQELMDSLHSSAATNLTTFGVQNLLLPAGSQPPEMLNGALRVLYKGVDGSKPEALQLCASPPELYKHLAEIKHDQELLMGVNATARGDIQSDKLSGSAMALLDTKAKQQSSSLHASYRSAIQALGNHIIAELRKRATAPRKVALVGKENAFLVAETEFEGKDFSSIKRVVVDLGNPLSVSLFGRTEQVKELVQMGLVNNLEQYYAVLDTGRAEPITQGLGNELLLIKSENEDIAKGEVPEAMLQDNHLLHCREHRNPVASPLARKNPAVLKAHTEHIHKHYAAFFGVEPMQPQVDPLTGMPVVDPQTQEPVLGPEPLYHDRMMLLLGLQPPPPMPGMPAPGAPGAPAPGAAPQPTDAQKAKMGAEAQPPESPPGSEPTAGQQPKQPSFPTNPTTGKKWDPSAPPSAA